MQRKLKRIYKTWDTWECYRAGFFENKPPKGATPEECLDAYSSFLRDLDKFGQGMDLVFKDWPNSCEHNLTNDKMNRIAWLGQSAMCRMTGIPSFFKGGYNRLSKDEQSAADALALKFLNKWLVSQGYPPTDGKRNHKTSNIY